ncbi:MAG: response regulator [Proteobacteria bacterium]|nr:response regulator [Pseudomonadota bacterium]
MTSSRTNTTTKAAAKTEKPKCPPLDEKTIKGTQELSENFTFDLTQLNVLVVDDSQFCRRTVRDSLSLFGIRHMAEASDAVEAINVLKENPIDLVLADYEMPYVSGVEMTRMIRKGAEVRDPAVPNVIVSSFTEQFRIREALAAGVQEYVVKPFSPEKLIQHIVHALNCPPSILEIAS